MLNNLLLNSLLYFKNIDIELLRFLHVERNSNFDTLFQIITNSIIYLAIAIPLLFFIVGLIKKSKIIRKIAYQITASILLSGAISTTIKYLVGRERPFYTHPEIEKLSTGGSPSFPSGHSADAFAIATALYIIYPKWYIFILAYSWAGLIAYSRMRLGVHYPSDVIVGISIGIFSAFIIYLVSKKKNFLNRDIN